MDWDFFFGPHFDPKLVNESMVQMFAKHMKICLDKLPSKGLKWIGSVLKFV